MLDDVGEMIPAGADAHRIEAGVSGYEGRDTDAALDSVPGPSLGITGKTQPNDDKNPGTNISADTNMVESKGTRGLTGGGHTESAQMQENSLEKWTDGMQPPERGLDVHHELPADAVPHLSPRAAHFMHLQMQIFMMCTRQAGLIANRTLYKSGGMLGILGGLTFKGKEVRIASLMTSSLVNIQTPRILR